MAAPYLATEIHEVIFVFQENGIEAQIRTFFRPKQTIPDDNQWSNHLRSDFCNGFTQVQSTSCSMHLIKTRRVFPAPIQDYISIPVTPIQGRVGLNAGAHQLAVVVTCRWGPVGSGRPGRMYVPGIIYTAYQNGAMSADGINNCRNMIDWFQLRYTASGVSGHLEQRILAKGPGGTLNYFPVVKYEYQPELGTIRRRRRETI